MAPSLTPNTLHLVALVVAVAVCVPSMTVAGALKKFGKKRECIFKSICIGDTTTYAMPPAIEYHVFNRKECEEDCNDDEACQAYQVGKDTREQLGCKLFFGPVEGALKVSYNTKCCRDLDNNVASICATNVPDVTKGLLDAQACQEVFGKLNGDTSVCTHPTTSLCEVLDIPTPCDTNSVGAAFRTMCPVTCGTCE
jgi:hypothetical protein